MALQRTKWRLNVPSSKNTGEQGRLISTGIALEEYMFNTFSGGSEG